MLNEPDKNTLEALRKGDLQAFERTLFSWERPIFNYLLRLAKHREDAEDLTQETFIKLYQNAGQVDPTRNFKSWLYTIATNTFYDSLRQKKRRPEIWPFDENQEILETSDQLLTYNLTEGRETSDILEKSLANLKPLYQTVLWLFYKEEFSTQEIADILKSPLNTVKTHLRRARLALKQELTKNGYTKS